MNDTLLTVRKSLKRIDDQGEKFDEDLDSRRKSSRLSRFTSERSTSALVGALTNELTTSGWRFKGRVIYIIQQN